MLNVEDDYSNPSSDKLDKKKYVCFPGIRVKLSACLLPEHDEDDGKVAKDAPNHTEDVHAEVEAQLGNSGPGVCHRLGGLITN